MAKNVYNRYIPGYHQYGFGSWLSKNANWLLPVGAGIATVATGGLASPLLGASMAGGSAIGNAVTGSYNQNQAADAQQQAMQQSQLNQLTQSRLSSMQDQNQYSSVFACGGKMHNNGGILNSLGDGGIYIKPENRGKFNATKERTGKTTEELTHSKNPLTRKRAIFAQNAAKWHHPDGGNLSNSTPPNYQNAWFNIGDSQADLTAALANKYPNVPVKNIVSDFAGKKDFSNLNLGQYSDSLKNVYGDIYLTPDEVKQYAPKYYDYIGTLRQGDPISTQGQFDTIKEPYFGYRSMLERRYKAGDTSPYKILSRANGGMLENITQYPVGGTHEQNKYGGVMVGNGNTVEQGEVRYKDYIFSDRLKRRS